MSDADEPNADKMPDDEVLEEPSTEKDPGEEPKDGDAEPEEEAVSHRAEGIGVIDAPDGAAADGQESAPQDGAAQGAKSDDVPPTDAASDEVKSDAAGIADSGVSAE